jgi:protein TonB
MKPIKTEKANLENKKFIFRELGMIVALGLILLAFNWKTEDKSRTELYERQMIDIPEEIVPITEQKPPELPKVQPPQVVSTINIVDDNVDVDDEIKIDVEADQSTEIEQYIPPVPVQGEEEEAVEEAEIFYVVEAMPSFPGGEDKIYDFLARNLKYPDMAKEAGIQGRVYLTFVVERDGSITDVKVLRGIGGGCDEEAVRVVESMPKWEPGRQRGIPVRVQFNLPIKFTLQ